jgi:hypothetical protein
VAATTLFAMGATRAPERAIAPAAETAPPAPIAPAIDAGTVEESQVPAIDAAPAPLAADAAVAVPIDAAAPAIDTRARESSSSRHPRRVKRDSEDPRSVPPAPGPLGDTVDPCQMDEQGNVIDRHRCKE